MSKQTVKSTIFGGIPSLIVELLSPSNSVEEVNETIDVYLAAKVPLIWIIDPDRRTASVYQPNRPAKLVNENEQLDGADVLPRFSVTLAELFD
jgi:Uma2 family endonuclease